MAKRSLLFSFFLAAAMLVPASCSAPDDETWVRVTSVSKSAGEGEGSTAISVISSDLRDGGPELIDIVLENGTVIVGNTAGGGVLVTVYHATVEYFVQGQNLPSYQYVVTLFLPPPGSGDAGDASSTGTLEDFPLVPAALKSWILNPANFPAEIADRGFSGEARITLRARTEEGRELETSAGITVVFN